MTQFPTFPLSGTADLGMGRVVIPLRVQGGDEIHIQGHHLLCSQFKDSTPFLCQEGKGSFITDHPPNTTQPNIIITPNIRHVHQSNINI